jgi:F1F0 ATPase subunit 2
VTEALSVQTIWIFLAGLAGSAPLIGVSMGVMLMFVAGGLLAALYLAGLWLTVLYIHRPHHSYHKRHPHHERPKAGLWLTISLVLRLLLLLVALYLILGDGQWRHLLAALAGFMTLRQLVTRRVQRQVAAATSKPKGLV